MRSTIWVVILSLLGAEAFAGVSVSIGIPGLRFDSDSSVVRFQAPRHKRRVVFVEEDPDDDDTVYMHRRYSRPCAGWSAFGNYVDGGGCNPFGCWAPGGSCNPFGCAKYGQCSAVSCPSKVPSYQCEK